MKFKALVIAAFVALGASQAAAHHSFAMFDPEKLLTQTGTVKEFEWANPHVWLHVMVPDQAAGKSPRILVRDAGRPAGDVRWLARRHGETGRQGHRSNIIR